MRATCPRCEADSFHRLTIDDEDAAAAEVILSDSTSLPLLYFPSLVSCCLTCAEYHGTINAGAAQAGLSYRLIWNQ